MPMSLPITIRSHFKITDFVFEDLLTYRYDAIDLHTNCSVSVWEFKSEWLSAALIQELIKKSEQLIRIEHDHLLSIRDYDYDGDRFLVVTDSMTSFYSIDSFLGKSKFSMKQLWSWSTDLFSVLTYLEQNGLYHGSLSFRMIWVNKDKHLKVVLPLLYALVLVRVVSEVDVVDDLLFLAPEIIQFQTLDSRSDMYSMGILLFTFFSKAWPYPYTDFVKEYKENLLANPRVFVPYSDKLPEKLEALIERCLMKDSVNRFDSFVALVDSYKTGQSMSIDTVGESKVDLSLKNDLQGSRFGYWKNWVKWILILISFLILLGNGFYFSNTFFNRIPDKRVPDVIGLPEDKAQSLLLEFGFDSEVVGGRFHMSLPEGAIVSTKPPPGRDVKANRKVRLFISKGIPQVLVSDFVGRSLKRGEELAAERQHGIEVVAEVYSDLYEKGVVISQIPTPNSFLAVSQNVQVEVSKGFPVSFSVEKVDSWLFLNKNNFRRVKVTFQVLDSWADQDIRIVYRINDRKEVLYRQRKLSGQQDIQYFELELEGVVDFYFNDELAVSYIVKDLDENSDE